MSEPIRLLHFADVHIGMENYGRIDPSSGISSRVMDFLRRLTEIVEFAEEHDADLAIFAGDAFKTRQPNPTYQREFARRIKRLARQCPVVLLVGNHDIPTMVSKASTVEIFHTLDVGNVMVGRSDQLHVVETKRGPVQVATVPYPVRQRLLREIDTRGLNIGSLDDMLQGSVQAIINDLAAQVDPALPAVLTGHFTVMGARVGSEQNVMLGRDVAVLHSTVASPVWDYVAMGHIHYHQDMNRGNHPPVVYSGSIERIDFGEEGAAKGFCWVELARGSAPYQFIELPARPFRTIRVDVRDRDLPTQEVLDAIARHDVADAVVRVIVTMYPEQEAQLHEREIEAALADADYIAAIQRDIDYPIRARIGVEHPEGLSHEEALERYLHAKEVDPERITRLLEAAQTLMDDPDGAG